MKQQTAVEWLECELKKIPFINVIEVFEQAKAKEKEQICNSYVEGLEGLYLGAEKYYNETFNQNK